MVDAEAVSRLMSGGKSGDMPIARLAAERIKTLVKPRSAFKIFGYRDGMILGAQLKLNGKDIRNHLQGCEEIVVFAATAGKELDDEIERLSALKISLAYALDIAGSLAVEEICDEAETLLRKQVSERGLGLTPRFSCGYGDFPLETQPSILGLLDAAKTAGIVLGDGLTMCPSKSVTAVLGIGRQVVSGKRDCSSCRYSAVCQHKLCALKA